MTFKVSFATPDKLIFNGEAISLSLPGSQGSFEVLADHAPIMSLLTIGCIVLVDKDKQTSTWDISTGYFEMSHNQASILAETSDSSPI